MYSAIPPASPGAPSSTTAPVANPYFVNIDSTNAGCAIQVTGRAFVLSANDLYNANQTIRWNRSRMHRIRNYTATSITILAQGIPGGTTDNKLGVVADGALISTVVVTNSDADARWYTVSGLPTGSKTIDLYEEFQDRTSAINSSVDGKASGVYVLAIQGTNGAVYGSPTASVGIAAFGDSHIDGLADAPQSYYGWCGQLRRAAMARGWLLTYVGAGSSTLCADGPTAAQTAAMIHDGWANMGCTVKKFLMMRRPNDYAYYAPANGPGTITPTNYQTYIEGIQTALDASDPGWTGIYTRIPQGTSWGNNAGGFSRANYWTATVAASTSGGRTNVQTFDETVFTAAGVVLNDAAGWSEANPGEVHMLQPNHNRVFGVVRTWYGL